MRGEGGEGTDRVRRVGRDIGVRGRREWKGVTDFNPPNTQAFDQERARMDGDCNLSCKTAQELRRSYLGFAKLTATNKKKLESALEKDPPRLADQEK